MKANPLISIITVVYNGELVLNATLNSAINQSYKNIELVIIDGGSTDNTLEVAHHFDNYIGTLVSEKDNGIYDAMNKGIKAAKGDWLYFLNAGDSFYNNQVLQSIFGNNLPMQILFIYGKVQTINEPTGVDYVTGKKVTFTDFYSHYPICHQATFTHRMAFEKIGTFSTGYKLAADTEWFVRLFKQNENNTNYINSIIAYYDIQGTTYHKRMLGYKEYLTFGDIHFPLFIAFKNRILYPIIWVKVKLIRLFTGTKLFALYRKYKFKPTT